MFVNRQDVLKLRESGHHGHMLSPATYAIRHALVIIGPDVARSIEANFTSR